jgi:phytoene synthase
MSLQVVQWENHLLELAQQGIEEETSFDKPLLENSAKIDLAYRHCNEITRFHSKTFFMASSLLPADKKRAIRALYAFCRISDDLVDRYEGDIQASLDDWHQRLYSLRQNSPPQGVSSSGEIQEENQVPNSFFPELVALAWEDTSRTYRIPRVYAEQLICGVAEDLSKKRYQTFADLATYCYGVACTVGLMSMYIIGFDGDHAVPYAIRLGVALQLTNILRDIGEDWSIGRLYLPQDEMDEFGITENQIESGTIDDKWREFMRFQIDRTRKLYADAFPGIGLLDKDGRFAIGAAAELYRGILDEIEENDYQVFNHRAHLTSVGKLKKLPQIWWRVRNLEK